jgi:hypothetical protein
MSEKFGLHWWKEDARRMAQFIHIMSEETKEENKRAGGNQKSQKFRPAIKR